MRRSQGVEFGVERLEVRSIDLLVPRIGLAEGRGHVGGHRLQQRRRQPDMGIGSDLRPRRPHGWTPAVGLNSGGGIDDGKVCRSPGNVFDQAVFERHADAKEEPCLAQRDHLPRRGLEDMRILSRLHEHFDMDVWAADPFDQIGDRRNAGEGL